MYVMIILATNEYPARERRWLWEDNEGVSVMRKNDTIFWWSPVDSPCVKSLGWYLFWSMTGCSSCARRAESLCAFRSWWPDGISWLFFPPCHFIFYSSMTSTAPSSRPLYPCFEPSLTMRYNVVPSLSCSRVGKSKMLCTDMRKLFYRYWLSVILTTTSEEVHDEIRFICNLWLSVYLGQSHFSPLRYRQCIFRRYHYLIFWSGPRTHN